VPDTVPPKIEIVAMRSWGEFGNYLAATTLARSIETRMRAVELTLHAAEDFVPRLRMIGDDIATVTVGSPDSATRARRYAALMERLDAFFYRGFEIDRATAPRADELESLARHFRASRPDLVIGTKGLISRLCVAALRLARSSAPVLNFVTNQGLLGFPVHHAPHAVITLVPFERARESLLSHENFRSADIRTVGPLIARHDLKDFLVDADATDGGQAVWISEAGETRPKVIVFSNRGGTEYLEILCHLAGWSQAIDLVFVSYNNEESTRAASAAASGTMTAHWRFHDRLTQAEYFGYINAAAKAQHSLLISKAGPNTTMEAAYFGIPVLLLASGLPMEDWVSDLIHENGLGRCCESATELVHTLDRWLSDRRMITAHKRHTTLFANRTLDQDAVADRIAEAVQDALRAA
jgi:UDP-N-acetylglucosamine:LPS N-acetylglucosamine transferase